MRPTVGEPARRAKAALSLVLLLLGAPVRAQGFPEAWLEEGLARFEASPPAVVLREGMAASQLTIRQSLMESPFSIEARTGVTGFQLNSDQAELLSLGRRTLSVNAGASARYLTRSGLSATLRADAVHDRFQEPDPLPAALQGQFRTVDLPYQVGLDLSYDLVRGGDAGRERTVARINEQNAWTQLFASSQELIDSRVQFWGLLTELYATTCKISELQAARGDVGKTVLEGKVQVQTKTISYKDYLNFLDLESSFARRIAGLEAQQRALAQRLVAFGPEAAAQANQIPGTAKSCQLDLEILVKRASAARPGDDENARLARALPSFASARSALEAARLRLRLSQLDNDPSVAPFLSGELSRQAYAFQNLGSLTAGISVKWDVPGQRGATAVAAAEATAKAAQVALEAAYLRNRSALAVLASEIESLERSHEVLKRSLETSRELLRTLVAQRAIGLVDSLSYTNAYLNSLEAKLSVLDVWDQLQRDSFELRAYREWERANGAADRE